MTYFTCDNLRHTAFAQTFVAYGAGHIAVTKTVSNGLAALCVKFSIQRGY